MTDPLLEIDGLSVAFDTPAGRVQAVRQVSFRLAPGEVLALVGESGSGKSVTAQAILGLTPVPPGRVTAGSVRYRGAELVGASGRALAQVRGRGISMIFQDPLTSLNPSMRIGAQIAEVVKRHGNATDSRARVLDLLRLVGIPEPSRRIDQYPHQFSGGMRQRIMIAIALANNPEILIADEPTTALDVTIQSQIFRLIRELQQRLGTAMILITHDLGLVAGLATRIAVMYAGRIVEEGPTDQIYYDPQHPYTAGLLASVARAEDDPSAPLRTIEGLPPVLVDPPPACAFAPRCPQAMALCHSREPGEFVPRKGTRARCWLHHPGAADRLAAFRTGRAG